MVKGAVQRHMTNLHELEALVSPKSRNAETEARRLHAEMNQASTDDLERARERSDPSNVCNIVGAELCFDLRVQLIERAAEGCKVLLFRACA